MVAQVASATPPKFSFYEVVRVTAEPPPQPKKTPLPALLGKEGIVNGMSDPYGDGSRDFAVHVNEFGYTFALHESLLESTGRIAKPEDIVSHPRRWRS